MKSSVWNTEKIRLTGSRRTNGNLAVVLVVILAALLLAGCTSSEEPATPLVAADTPAATTTPETMPSPTPTAEPSVTPVPSNMLTTTATVTAMPTPIETATPYPSPTATSVPSITPTNTPAGTPLPTAEVVSITAPEYLQGPRYSPVSGEYEQLTQYSDGHERLGPQFSPGFRYFANMRYAIDHDEDGRTYREYDVAERPIEIVDITDLSQKTILLQTEKFGGVRMTQPHTIVWNPDAKTIAVFGHDGDGMVFWIDVSSGEITDVLELEDWAWDYAPSISTHQGVEKLELKGREGWFLFDRETREWTNLPLTTDVLVSAADMTPPDFPGEENCVYP